MAFSGCLLGLFFFCRSNQHQANKRSYASQGEQKQDYRDSDSPFPGREKSVDRAGLINERLKNKRSRMLAEGIQLTDRNKLTKIKVHAV